MALTLTPPRGWGGGESPTGPYAVTMSEPPPPPARPTLEPLPVPMTRIIGVGLGLWVVALVVILLVPTLHEGPRSWWPWGAVAGLGLGLVGYAYVRRGRGNASGA